MDLYNMIFKRRSVRKYTDEPLDESFLNEILALLNDAPGLPGAEGHFALAKENEVSDTRAPHYILAYCEESDLNYINIGYKLQKADLYIQSKGYGSLWLGMAKPKEQETDAFAIMLAFGKTDTPCRQSETDFSRLPIEEVSDADNAVTRAVRAAPSAVNSQPWKIYYSTEKLTLAYFGRGLLKAVLRKRLSKIDLGIAARHAEEALLAEGKEILSAKVAGGKNVYVEFLFR